MERFFGEMQPKESDLVLDVGVIDTDWRASNVFESAYPWPAGITALAPTPMPKFQALYPSVRFVVGDGRALPFADNSFDIGFSNAVVEHVGSREQQRQFVHELTRTCRRVFIATPNRRFPIDPHTLLPFVHWLPPRFRYPLLRALGKGEWASESMLNPLDARQFLLLFPSSVDTKVLRQRVLGMTTNIVVCASQRRAP
jgi:Methyltransferase domain.